VHRDLKPENMFFKSPNKQESAQCEVVLIDLGSSDDLSRPDLRQLQIDNDPKRMTHINFVGTS
jgi:serine/threonine protein kinase